MTFGNRLKLFRISAAWPNISVEKFGEMMDAAVIGEATRTGVVISPETAMNVAAFFCGVNIISGSIASCKLILYERLDERSKQRFQKHSLYGLLRKRVNENMTATYWKRLVMAHLLGWGNHYSLGARDPYRGNVTRLEPFHPQQVKVWKKKGTGELNYDVKFDDGHKETLTRSGPRFIFHVPGLGFNGVTGFSLLSIARESLGLTLAMEQFGANFFGQGVNAGGFLEMPEGKKMSEEARKRLIESIEEGYGGLNKSHRFVLLEEGAKFNRNTIPLEDAQFLLSRTFQIQEIARWLNIPPHKLKELSRATYSNIEHQQIEYIQDTIQPWCEAIESEICMQLIEPDLQDKLFAEFLLDSLLRGDTVSRNNALAIKRQWGVINADEWRAYDNENPLPDGLGEKYLVPTNYTVAENAGKEPKGPTRFAPPGKKEIPEEEEEPEEEESPDEEESEE